MKQIRFFIIYLSFVLLSQFLASCAPPLGRAYTGAVLSRNNVAYLITAMSGNYVESIDGVSKSKIDERNETSCGVLEIPVGKHTIKASFWQQTRGTTGWDKTTAGGDDGLPLTFVAEPRHIYRVANKSSCPEGKWCPYVKDITDKIDVPSNYEYIYQKAREQ